MAHFAITHSGSTRKQLTIENNSHKRWCRNFYLLQLKNIMEGNSVELGAGL